MNKQKPTVTIGIPAYNEEQNIFNLLQSVLRQKQNGFKIVEIILISDGSTDNTVNKVRKVKDKRLLIINNKKRDGKSVQLNKIFELAEGDIIVLFDADVVLYDSNTLHNLIKPIIKNRNVGLTGGYPVQSPTRNFLEQAIAIGNKAYEDARYKFRNGNNVYCCIGQILALSKKFAKSLYVPENVIANDNFMYFSCLSHNFKFEHAKSAKVLKRSPINLGDHFKQSERFITARKRLKKLFGKLAENEYKMTSHLLFYYKLKAFIKNPIHCLTLFILNVYASILAYKNRKKLNAVWSIAWSTKRRIRLSYDK